MSLLITPEIIQKTASHLVNVDPAVLQIFIDEATLEVEDLDISEGNKERLVRLYATHLASLKAENIKREKLDGLETEYHAPVASAALESTSYGQEYQRLFNKLTEKPKSLNLMVL